MLHKHAGIKALRQANKRRERNDVRRRTIEILTRQYEKARAANATGAAGLLPKLVQAIDKAAQRNVLDKNTSSRMKSRLMKHRAGVGA